MNTKEFIAKLEAHAAEALNFSAEGSGVTAGFHVTEIKSTAVSAMDCGGRAANWNELILQVLPPRAPSKTEQMSVEKFLGIYGRVANAIPLPEDAVVRVEYGEAGYSAISYLVSAIEAGPEGVKVELAAPTVACKAKDPLVGVVPLASAYEALQTAAKGDGSRAASCCGPQLVEASTGACCG